MMQRAEEQIALQHQHLDRIGLPVEHARIGGWSRDPAPKRAGVTGGAYHPDTGVAQSEHHEPGDDFDREALEKADHQKAGEYQEHDGAIHGRHPGPLLLEQRHRKLDRRIDQEQTEEQLGQIDHQRCGKQQHRAAQRGGDQAYQAAPGAEHVGQDAAAGRVIAGQRSGEPAQQIGDAGSFQFLVEVHLRADPDLDAGGGQQQGHQADQPEDDQLGQLERHDPQVGMAERADQKARRPHGLVTLHPDRWQQVARGLQLGQRYSRDPGDQPEQTDRGGHRDRQVEVVPAPPLHQRQHQGKDHTRQPVPQRVGTQQPHAVLEGQPPADHDLEAIAHEHQRRIGEEVADHRIGHEASEIAPSPPAEKQQHQAERQAGQDNQQQHGAERHRARRVRPQPVHRRDADDPKTHRRGDLSPTERRRVAAPQREHDTGQRRAQHAKADAEAQIGRKRPGKDRRRHRDRAEQGHQPTDHAGDQGGQLAPKRRPHGLRHAARETDIRRRAWLAAGHCQPPVLPRSSP